MKPVKVVSCIGDEVAAHLLGSLQLRDVVQGQHRDRVGVERGAVYAGKMGLQLPLDRSGEREINHPRRLAGQDRIGRGQHSGVAEYGGEVVRPLDNAEERLRLRVGVNNPPPPVEQDQRIRNGGDDRLCGGKPRLGGADALAPHPRQPDDRKPQLADRASWPAGSMLGHRSRRLVIGG
jgi:hypothetical protein